MLYGLFSEVFTGMGFFFSFFVAPFAGVDILSGKMLLSKI